MFAGDTGMFHSELSGKGTRISIYVQPDTSDKPTIYPESAHEVDIITSMYRAKHVLIGIMCNKSVDWLLVKQNIDVNKAVVVRARTANEQGKEQQTSKARDSKRAKQEKLKTNAEGIHVRVNRARAMTAISVRGHNVNSKIMTEPAKKKA